MRTRPSTPRTGRPRKLKFTARRKGGKAKRPAQIAATMGRRKVRKSRRK